MKLPFETPYLHQPTLTPPMLPLIFFLLTPNLENVRECCKAQWVCVHQRIALYKRYLLLLWKHHFDDDDDDDHNDDDDDL